MAGSETSAQPGNFRSWLDGKAATESKLNTYLSSVGEWWRSEFKAATTDIDHGLRKTVCALANMRGGEVFLGVRDHRTQIGTSVDEQRLGQILKQEHARPADWFVVDLNLVVSYVTPIALTSQPGKRVYILEVKPPGLPTFVLEDHNELSLFLRRGESTERANSFKAIEWQRNVSREDVLRNLYLELRTLSRTIGGGYLGLAVNLGLTVPYLTRRLEDGTLYKCLSDDDLLFLLGKAQGNSRYEGGIYQDLFEARYEIAKEMSMGMARHEVDDSVDEILTRASESLRSRTETLRRYLNRNGIVAD